LKSFDGFNESLDRDEDKYLCCQLRTKGLRFIQSRDTLVMHHFTSEGRNEGFFSYFKDSNRFYRSVLYGRVDLLLSFSWARLLFLPLLDIFVFPQLLYKIYSGRYLPSRFTRLEDGKSLLSLSSFGFIAYILFCSYLSGYRKLISELRKFLLVNASSN